MSFHESVAVADRTRSQPKAAGLLVQRKCACGTHTPEGECGACRKKRTGLQRSDRSQSHPGMVATPLPMLATATRLQRQPLLGARSGPVGASPAATGSTATPGPVTEAVPNAIPEVTPAPTGAVPAGPLIAEDTAAALEPGQLRKSEFLDRLEAMVCAEADAALAASGRSTDGCPYLTRWFAHYRGQSGAHVEAALQRYAPESRNARTAADYIPLVTARVRQGVERWATTGEITGVPENVPLTVPGVSGLAGAAGALAAGVGGLLFKAREGGARAADDPAAIRQALGSGRPLGSGVRSRMERAFGQSFAHVRTHTDTTAQRLSSEQNARAFTVGEHVAFGAGEYRPGTMLGDALVAHELAHVVQQRGSGSDIAPLRMGGASYDTLEEDADRVAGGAVAALWGGSKRTLGSIAHNASRLRSSGLRLQRCSRDETSQPAKKTELAALCDDPSCLKRSGCKVDECKAEAKTVTETYVKRVAAIRRPDMPNQGDIHWGWMCYQWAGLLMREFEKLSPNCWQIRWVGIVSSGGNLDHNYVFTSLGPATSDKGPVRDCGLILDPWRTGNPVVYGGEWNWHKWNYIHDTKDDTGRVYQNGKWKDVTYPPPWTPAEPAPRGP